MWSVPLRARVRILASDPAVRLAAPPCRLPFSMVKSIGADHVIDYTREDFTKSGQRYDLILGANAHHSIFDYRRALSQDGIFVMVGGGLGRVFQAMLLGPFLSRIGSKKMRFFIAKINTKDLVFLKSLLEAGKVVPVIDRRYPLSDAAEALRYREEGHAKGKSQ